MGLFSSKERMKLSLTTTNESSGFVDEGAKFRVAVEVFHHHYRKGLIANCDELGQTQQGRLPFEVPRCS